MLPRYLAAFLLVSTAGLVAAPMRVACLNDPLPGGEPRVAAALCGALIQQGHLVRLLSMEQLGDRAAFGPDRFDLLVLAQGYRFTKAASENFFAFVNAGGDLILADGTRFLPDRVRGRALAIPAFSKYEPYRLSDVRSITAAPGQGILSKNIRIEGRFSGISAVGFARTSARFHPLLSAQDSHGRTAGWAAGLLTHFAEYKGSNWLLFGLSDPEFYEHPAIASLLAEVLPKMAGTALTEMALQERNTRLANRIKLTAPPPHSGFVRRSPDGRHLLLPDGRRFFMIGANYHRSLEIGEWYSSKEFDDTAFEDDFRKARDAGVNCIRLGPASRFYEDPELVKQCARKYGIYVLVLLNWGTRQDFVENAERVARMYAGEPMVLGYDIQNEPTLEAVTGLRFDGRRSPVLDLDPYERYQKLFDKAALDRAVESRLAGRVPRNADPQDQRNLAAMSTLWLKATELLTRDSASTFPGLTDALRVGEEYRELTAAVDKTFEMWISRHIEAIRKFDKDHLITVGYNTLSAALPANRLLDFASHHVYDWPLSYELVQSNLTTMDRIARLWPDKPVTLGEFGYSNGVPMPDGKLLDFQTAAIGEMAHYLYALARNYDGCMKWVVTDWHWDPIAKAADRGRVIQIYEAYFGMYWYDGNPQGLGRPKPIAYATRFLRDYVDSDGPGGTIEIVRSDNAMGTGYRFRSKNALFVGDSRFKSPEVEFDAGTPLNVMLRWGKGGADVMCTADGTVRIAPGALTPDWRADRMKVSGQGASRVQGSWIELDALAGEVIHIAPEK